MDRDSSRSSGLIAMLLLQHDTSGISIDFRKDSTYIQLSKNSDEHGRYYVKDSALYVANNFTYVPYKLSVTNDSVVNIYTNDNTMVLLKRQ